MLLRKGTERNCIGPLSMKRPGKAAEITGRERKLAENDRSGEDRGGS